MVKKRKADFLEEYEMMHRSADPEERGIICKKALKYFDATIKNGGISKEEYEASVLGRLRCRMDLGQMLTARFETQDIDIEPNTVQGIKFALLRAGVLCSLKNYLEAYDHVKAVFPHVYRLGIQSQVEPMVTELCEILPAGIDKRLRLLDKVVAAQQKAGCHFK